MRRISLGQRGDTIVEVLIAVAIVSLVLTAAYALTNRNLQRIQAVQEQSYAQRLVEQQVEYLRASDSANRPSSSGQCYTDAHNLGSGAGCTVTSGGASYIRSISTADGTYTITVTWQTLGGGNATVTAYYRVPAV